MINKLTLENNIKIKEKCDKIKHLETIIELNKMSQNIINKSEKNIKHNNKTEKLNQ